MFSPSNVNESRPSKRRGSLLQALRTVASPKLGKIFGKKPPLEHQSPSHDDKLLLIASSPPVSPDVTEDRIFNPLGISIPLEQTSSQTSLLDSIPVLPAIGSFDGFGSHIEWFTPPEPNPFDSPEFTSNTTLADTSGAPSDNLCAEMKTLASSPVLEECSFEDFDEGAVQYILDSMEDSMPSSELIPDTHAYSKLRSSSFQPSSSSHGSASGSTGSLLGSRHKKDPIYAELPSISIIEATPRGLCEFTFDFPQPPTTIPIKTETSAAVGSPTSPKLCCHKTSSTGISNRAEVGRPSPTEDLYIGPSEHAHGPSMLSFLVNALGSRIRRATMSGGERPDRKSVV